MLPSQYRMLERGGHGSLQRPQSTNTGDTIAENTLAIMNNLRSQNVFSVSGNQQRNPEPLLFPPRQARQQPQQSQQHYQLGIPVHQSYLQDTLSFPQDTAATSSGNQKLFSYLKGFLLQPVQVKPLTQNAQAKFEVDAETFSKLPTVNADTTFGGSSTRRIGLDSILIRVRCIGNTVAPVPEATWAVTDTEWPPSLVLLVNDKNIQVRRKAEWGKDLAADITANVVQGRNQIRASFLKTRQAPEWKSSYALAVEILAIGDEDSTRKQVRTIDASETRSRICRQPSNADDEIEVISSDLVVKVTDPFSAQLLRTPIRGKDCVHYECFDLNIFLQTRKGTSLMPEQFRCPICGSDARPMKLRLDLWFLEVLTKIREAGEEEAKAIVISPNAQWRVKEEEKEGEGGDGTGARTDVKHDTPGQARQGSVVIELD